MHCDLFNPVADFYGTGIPDSAGILVAVNINGDSCDIYHNIFLEPFFVAPFQYDFHLLDYSPCIDAGDPALPLDPDGTINDIGALPFFQASPQIALSSGSLTFPPTYIGETSELPLVVYNLGGADLIIYSMECVLFPYVFSVNWNPNDSLIAPGDSLELAVTFAPSDTGLYFDRLQIDNNDVLAEAALQGEGLPQSSIDPRNNPAPEIFTLYAPYPNPFNPETRLTFNLPAPGKTDLTVFDVQGNPVAVLVDGWRQGGTHTVIFDASDLPSGVYFAKLTSNDIFQVRKLLLLK